LFISKTKTSFFFSGGGPGNIEQGLMSAKNMLY
jgi:hypothetical protein